MVTYSVRGQASTPHLMRHDGRKNGDQAKQSGRRRLDEQLMEQAALPQLSLICAIPKSPP